MPGTSVGSASRRTALLSTGGALSAVALLAGGVGPATAHSTGSPNGPSTTVAPYVVPVSAQVKTTSILTVNDKPATDGTGLVGIPDGIGLQDNYRSATIYVNHELRNTSGIVRAHGQKGAFVSKWKLDPETLEVKSGGDLIQSVRYWDYTAGAFAAAPVAPAGAAAGTHTAEFNRFCSGHLAPAGTFKSGSYGYGDALYFPNEESGPEGRLFGVTTSGTAYQLPRAGLFSWENSLAAQNKSRTTLVIGNEDTADGQVWIYAGTKQKAGNPVERAGLTNGNLFVVDAVNEAVSSDVQFRSTYGKGTPAPVTFGANEQIDWTKNGVTQNAEAAGKGLTLNRIEDGEFDPRNPNDYYFLTTEGGDKTDNPAEPGVARDGGGLWKLSFRNIDKPELGGTLTLLLDGTEAPYLNKPDNLTIDRRGHILIQEDPGGNDHVARIVAYRIKDGALATLAEFDRAKFGVTNPAGTTPDTRAVLTTDEESSGIVDASSIFGSGSFLFDAQVHTTKGLPAGTGPGTVEELVENGQLLLLNVDNWNKVFRPSTKS
jgi:hypothetical protein